MAAARRDWPSSAAIPSVGSACSSSASAGSAGTARRRLDHPHLARPPHGLRPQRMVFARGAVARALRRAGGWPRSRARRRRAAPRPPPSPRLRESSRACSPRSARCSGQRGSSSRCAAPRSAPSVATLRQVDDDVRYLIALDGLGELGATRRRATRVSAARCSSARRAATARCSRRVSPTAPSVAATAPLSERYVVGGFRSPLIDPAVRCTTRRCARVSGRQRGAV